MDVTSSGSSHATDETPSVHSLLEGIRRTFAQLPRPLQGLAHLLLIILLVFAVYDVGPRDLHSPLGRPVISLNAISAATGGNVTFENVAAVTNSRYLDSRPVPFTARVMRESLPMGEPQREVQTSVFTYTVQPGDTVLGIAQKFGLEGNSILWGNEDLADNPDFLRLGQTLNILPVDGAYHTVAKGETVEDIAQEYKVDPSAITSYAGNDLDAPYELQQGDKLIIPGGVKPYVPRHVVAYEGAIPADAEKGTGTFAWPMSGYITQKFWSGHQAIDIGAPRGTPIVAADSGYVAVAQYSDVGYGRMLIIDHGNGYQTLYAHLNAHFVEVGTSVSKGQLIGHCGTTGHSTGPHLHFEIIKNSVRRNPMIYLP
ncbi:MAG: M23 family metallopeptidase [Chloroflexota bacterium]|nr:M23 family metallopeptidase [Chloroflexota bacterium]